MRTGNRQCQGRCLFHAGDKLIDHLKHWMNPEEVSGSTLPIAWRLGEQPAVAAAILELFHLLPAQSSKFMETEGAAGSVLLNTKERTCSIFSPQMSRGGADTLTLTFVSCCMPITALASMAASGRLPLPASGRS
jgi:hypothetical protein